MSAHTASIASLIFLAAALVYVAFNASKRVNQASDDLIDASTHYDVRTLDLLNPPHGDGV